MDLVGLVRTALHLSNAYFVLFSYVRENVRSCAVGTSVLVQNCIILSEVKKISPINLVKRDLNNCSV